MRNPIRNDAGAVLIEAAIVLPVMLLVILGGLDLGLGMVVATRLNFATEAAAACGAVAACPDAAAFASQQSGIPAGAFSVAQSPTMVTVSASYPYKFFFLPWTITLQSAASFPVLPPPTTVPPPTKS